MLSTADEDALIAAAQTGDVSARNRLVSAYAPLVLCIAAERVRPAQIEDATSEGALALIRAVELYDSAHDRPFSSFAAMLVRQHLTRWRKKERRVGFTGKSNQHLARVKPQAGSMDAELKDFEGVTTLHDILAADEPTAEQAHLDAEDRRERRMFLRRVLRSLRQLDPPARAMVVGRVHGKTFAEVAGGKSRQSAQQAIARVQAKLRSASL